MHVVLSALDTVFAQQSLQVGWPGVSWYCPSAHSIQLLALKYLPGGQGTDKKTKQEAYRPHCSAEKQFLENSLCKTMITITLVELKKKIKILIFLLRKEWSLIY